MKKFICFVFVMTLCSHTASAQESVGFTESDNTFHLESYRLPAWGYNQLLMDFSGQFAASNNFLATKDRSTILQITPRYRHYRESENLIISADAELPLLYYYSTSKDALNTEYTVSTFQGILSLQGDGKFYPGNQRNNDQLFGTGKALISVITDRVTTDGNVLYVIDGTNYRDVLRKTAHTQVQVHGGIGYGRVRNVTPVIRALRLNERLNARNTGNLTDRQIQEAASVLAQQSGYNGVFDRTSRHLWDAIGDIAPDIFDHLSIYDAYFLGEILQESTGQRYEGWDISGNVFVDHRRYFEDRKSEGSTVLETDQTETRYGLEIAGRWFHNLSLKHMVSARANMGYGRTTYSDQNESESLALARLEIGHLYNITDRLLIQSGIGTEYERTGSGVMTEYVNRFNTTLTYFVENNVSVSTDLSYIHVKQNLVTEQTRSHFEATVSLRYYFFRSML